MKNHKHLQSDKYAGFVLLATLLSMFAVLMPLNAANAALDRPIALDAQVIGDEDASRVIIDFDASVDFAPQLLKHPWRLVLDFERIGYGFDPNPENWTGFAQDIRWGDMSETNSRIIFEMDHPFRIVNLQMNERQATGTHQLIVDLVKTDVKSFEAAILDRMRTSAVVRREEKSDRLGIAQRDADAFIVALDPGHGGIDPGAVGRGNTLEKDITLAFVRQLREKLNRRSGIKVVMTRDEDIFVRLNDRVRFARQSEADLFISIHADSIRESYVRGATVYTISDKASDAISARVAESENRADEIAGINFEEEPDQVADILVDLARRETLGFSVQFARLVVDKFSEKTQMIKNPHRHAGFRVLTAPDVPSVLIELGYLSNKEDEAQLLQEDWRDQMAEQLAAAISGFAELSGRNVAQSVPN